MINRARITDKYRVNGILIHFFLQNILAGYLHSNNVGPTRVGAGASTPTAHSAAVLPGDSERGRGEYIR